MLSDSVGLEWRLRFYISNKFTGGVYAAGPGTTLWIARDQMHIFMGTRPYLGVLKVIEP